jgi:hypothetical protein
MFIRFAALVQGSRGVSPAHVDAAEIVAWNASTQKDQDVVNLVLRNGLVLFLAEPYDDVTNKSLDARGQDPTAAPNPFPLRKPS